MIQFNHFNFNVLDLEKSLKFYKDTLNLEPVREKNAADGSFKLVYLGDGTSDFTLELTWLRDRTEPYNHHRAHRPYHGCCQENPERGLRHYPGRTHRR